MALMLVTLLVTGTSFTTVSRQPPAYPESSRARINATLRLSQIVLGIEVLIPTAIYSVENLNTNENGTVLNANVYNVSVQEGDVLYLNSFSLPLAIFYTVTAEDIASGAIHVNILE